MAELILTIAVIQTAITDYGWRGLLSCVGVGLALHLVARIRNRHEGRTLFSLMSRYR